MVYDTENIEKRIAYHYGRASREDQMLSMQENEYFNYPFAVASAWFVGFTDKAVGMGDSFRLKFNKLEGSVDGKTV